MTVTPSIIGDGNVLLDVQVNNDSVNRAVSGDPGINKMEISYKTFNCRWRYSCYWWNKKNKYLTQKNNFLD